MVKKKCIFLDRDGVINRSKAINGKPYAPTLFKNFIFLPQVKLSISLLKKKKYLIIVITNQPDISNGKLNISEFSLMTNKTFKNLKIDDLFFCPHSSFQNCKCRKPKLGMFDKAVKKHNIDIGKSYMIGDRKSDIEAGKSLKCKTIFIDKNYLENKPINFDYSCKSLYKALQYIK